MPGRSGPPAGDSGTPIPSRRFTSVPVRRCSVGCVTSPAGFATTRRCSSSIADRHRRALRRERLARPELDLRAARRPASRKDFGRAAPSTSTRPSAIARCTSARGTPESRGDDGVEPAGLARRRSQRSSRRARPSPAIGPPGAAPERLRGHRRTSARRIAPTTIALSARLNTGQTCRSMKSTTRPREARAPRMSRSVEVAERAAEHQAQRDRRERRSCGGTRWRRSGPTRRCVAVAKNHGALWPMLKAPPGFVVKRNVSTPGISSIGRPASARSAQTFVRRSRQEDDRRGGERARPRRGAARGPRRYRRDCACASLMHRST